MSDPAKIEWIWAAIPIVGGIMVWIAKRWGDTNWEPRKTAAEQRVADDAHEQRMIALCNEEYVRRQRYHEDMGRISGIMARVQLDIGDLQVVAARQGAAIEAMGETLREHGETLRAILLHTRELNERDRSWYEAQAKRHLPPA